MLGRAATTPLFASTPGLHFVARAGGRDVSAVSAGPFPSFEGGAVSVLGEDVVEPDDLQDPLDLWRAGFDLERAAVALAVLVQVRVGREPRTSRGRSRPACPAGSPLPAPPGVPRGEGRWRRPPRPRAPRLRTAARRASRSGSPRANSAPLVGPGSSALTAPVSLGPEWVDRVAPRVRRSQPTARQMAPTETLVTAERHDSGPGPTPRTMASVRRAP